MIEAIPLLPQSACMEWTRMSFFFKQVLHVIHAQYIAKETR